MRLGTPAARRRPNTLDRAPAQPRPPTHVTVLTRHAPSPSHGTAEGNADGAANGQQAVGQVEGGCESISIKQAIKKKLISAEYLEAWWRSSLWWRGRGEKSGWAGS